MGGPVNQQVRVKDMLNLGQAQFRQTRSNPNFAELANLLQNVLMCEKEVMSSMTTRHALEPFNKMARKKTLSRAR